MQTPLLVRFSLLCVALGSSACSTLPSSDVAEPAAYVVGISTDLNEATVGSRVSLPAGDSSGVTSVRIVDEYRAASGRLCRRVHVDQSNDESRVMCQRQNGQWSFTRPLISSSLRQTMQANSLVSVPLNNELTQGGSNIVDTAAVAMVASSADDQDEPVLASATNIALATAQNSTPPPVQLRLNPGETLWRFAARTTGNPENWSRIAKLNGISDVGKIQGGSMLNVPAELFAGKR